MENLQWPWYFMFEDQTKYLDITNASGLAWQTILLHIDKLLSVALKHYCPDVWQFVCWSQGGQQERHTRKESSECPNDVPTHCETQKNTVEAKTAPTHLYGEIQIQIQQRQIWGKSKSMIIATQVSQVSTTLLSRTATPTKRPARAPQKWPIYLAHYIKAKLLFKRLFASPTVQLT